jgi:hypothetical protein
MTYSGVKLPEIQENYEADMEINSNPISQNEEYSRPRSEQYENRGPPTSNPENYREEYKGRSEYPDHAVIRAQVEEQQTHNAYNARAVPPAKGDDIDRSQYEVNESLQMTTFKPNHDDTPAEIDFDDFGGESRTQEHTDIDKLCEKHFQFLDSLKQRQQKIKNILSLYNPYKNINTTLNALKQMNDVGVTNDVCSALFVEGDFVNNLSMKQCLGSLPYAETLFNGKHENHVVTGALTIQRVLKHIGQDIITIRNYPVSQGVDLQREERINQCNDLLNTFLAIFKGSTLKKRVKYKGNIGKVSNNLYNDLYSFLALSDNSKGNDRQMDLA